MSFANPYSLPDFFKSGQEGRDAANADFKRKTLRDYLQPALGGDKDALARVYRADGELGMDVQKFGADQQRAQAEALKDKIAQTSAVMAQGGDQYAAQLYPQWREMVQQSLGMQLPEQYEPGAMQVIKHFAGAAGRGPEGRVVGDALVNPFNGQVMYQGQPKRQLVNVPDGQGGFIQKEYDGRNFYDPNYGGQPQVEPRPMTGGGAGVLENAFADTVQSAIAPLGGRITSTTGGKHNPGSKHYSGNAIDIGMGRETPEQQAQILASLQQIPGLVVRDERRRPAGQKVWSGPHLHVERAQGGAQGAPGRLGYTPPKDKADGFQTLSPAEIKAMGLPAGTVAQRGANGKIDVISKPDQKSGGQLPVQALRVDLDIEDALGAAQSATAIIAKHAQRLNSRELDLGPMTAAGAAIRTKLGRATKADANYTEFRADLQKMVNDSLRLNKGVQTEGDAERAAKEVMAANDNVTAARALKRLSEINRRGIELQQRKRAMLRQNYGGGAPSQPAPARSAPSDNDPLGIL